MKISLLNARRLALHAQMLDGRTRLSKGKEGTYQTIERLGYVQIDSISVIQRAHHHTVWTRLPDHSPDMIHELQTKDRRIFEYWGHALSYIPMTDYRYYLRRMQTFHDPHGKWERARLEKYGHLMKPVLDRIREEGSIRSKDLAQVGMAKSCPDQQGNPAKSAAELLFWRGELMISERINSERVYDLTERVIPDGTDTKVPADDELGRFLVRRALRAYGVAREREICDHIQAADRAAVVSAIQELLDSGEVTRVTLEGHDGTDHFALTEMLGAAAGLRKKAPRVHLLSPFDNLIIQRGRTEKLFGFEYALECYVTPAKRKHGYFVLPILWGEELIGRFDPKTDRKSGTMMILNLLFESSFTRYDEFLPEFVGKLRDFARFNNCENIRVVRCSPASIKRELTRQLKNHAI